MKVNRIAILLALFAWSLGITADAQDWNWNALSEQSNRLRGKLSGKVYYMPPEGNSQHFYQQGWHEGSILMEDGDLFENVRLRYLAYGDELVAYNYNVKQLFIVDKEKIAAFTVNTPQGTQEFVKLYFNGFISGDRFFEKLYDSKRKLLAFRSIEMRKTSMYNDKQGVRRNSVLVLRTSYYMYSEESGFKKIQPRRKSLLGLFPERKKEVRRLFRRNNFTVFNESEMVRAFKSLEEAGFF